MPWREPEVAPVRRFARGRSPAQPAAHRAIWFVVVTDIALIAAGLALLLRRKAAVWMFALSLSAIVVTNSNEIAVGTSRSLLSRAALLVTVTIVT